VSDEQLPSGAVLDGKWRIESVLGRGGMGAVYAASHVRNGSAVALKVLHRELCRDQALRERFLHEGYAANQVGHPGTVSIIDDGVAQDGSTYLVMERLQGRPLDAIADAQGGKLQLPEVLKHTLALLDVLSAAHAKGIVHRDIKPENVFLCNSGTLKVLDFGIAHVKEAQTKARLTVTGVPMGTPAFMPPEQALAHWDRVGTRSDVYSIGATMFTLLTGKLVHEARTLPELLVVVSTRPARPVRSLLPDLPPTIAGVIDRALAFEPHARWSDAREMREALAAACGAFGRETLQSGRAPTPSMVAPGAHAMRIVDESSAPGFGAVAATSGTRLHATQTAAPVSSSSKNTERSKHKRGVWLMVSGVALGGAVAGTALYVALGGPATTSAPSAAPSAPSSSPIVEPPAPPAKTSDELTVVPGASPRPTASVPAASSSPAPSATAAPTSRPQSKSGPKPRPEKTEPTAAPKPTSNNPLDFN
jgi:serine/threonine-protein kinase